MKKLGGSKVSAASAPWSPNGVVASRASIRVTSGAAPPAAAIAAPPYRRSGRRAATARPRAWWPAPVRAPPAPASARNGDRQPVEVDVQGPLGDLPAGIASYGELRAQPAVDPAASIGSVPSCGSPRSVSGRTVPRMTVTSPVVLVVTLSIPSCESRSARSGWEEVVDAVAAQRVEQICHGRRAGSDPHPRLRHRASGRPGNPVRCWVHSDGVEAARASSWTTPSALAVCGRNRPRESFGWRFPRTAIRTLRSRALGYKLRASSSRVRKERNREAGERHPCARAETADRAPRPMPKPLMPFVVPRVSNAQLADLLVGSPNSRT